jgi:hypothetical protein
MARCFNLNFKLYDSKFTFKLYQCILLYIQLQRKGGESMIYCKGLCRLYILVTTEIRDTDSHTCLLRNRFCWLASLSFLVSFALSVSASNAFICHIQFETEDLSKINWLKSHTTKMLSLASFREKINKNKGYF